jgi:transcriptional regulator with XRE-family HTH domain
MDKSKIKFVRLALGLSQSQFAKILGVQTLRISKWERGVATPGCAVQELLLALWQQIHDAPPDARSKEQVKAGLERSGEGERLATLLRVLFSEMGTSKEAPRTRRQGVARLHKEEVWVEDTLNELRKGNSGVVR